MTSGLDNDRLLRALRRETVDRTPVWIMRQAGRYLPEYRATRASAGNFMQLCQTPDLACEVTLQPLRRFPLDAAILFSDILTIPDAMGLGLRFIEGEGPRFDNPVRSADDVKRLGQPDPETDLGYVMEAVRVIRRELDGSVPLIGFAGSPWTLATYAVEGGPSQHFAIIKKMLMDEPRVLHALLDLLARSVATYLQAQIAAGAQALMVFDTWGGALSTPGYHEFSLAYLARIVEDTRVQREAESVPLVLFTKGGCQWLEAIAATGCDALGLDWSTDIGDARARVGARVALQGNLDPSLLHGNADAIRREVGLVLERYGHGSGHVFNLGHGIQPTTPIASMHACIESVHSLSPQYHGDAG